MNAALIYTRRRFGIDINVLLVMFLTVILCAGLISYKLIGKKACLPFNISATGFNNQKNGNFIAGETVMLKASLSPDNTIVWDFGDGTPTLDGSIATHIFLKPGKFTVTATEKGQCAQNLNITVGEKPIVDVHPEIVPLVTIIGNLMPTAGKEEKYQCSLQASSYEWSITNSTNFETKKGASVSYQFPLPGSYELQVKLDDDPSKTYTKQILVMAAPKPIVPKNETIPSLINHRIVNVEPEKHQVEDTSLPVVSKQPDVHVPDPIEKPKTKLIADNAFKTMLEDLIQNEKKISDFMPYLEYGLNTKVYENGKKEPIDFLTLCQHLQSSKRIQIKLLILNREENKNVQSIEIKHKKPWL